jgi:hypothetical protein
VNIFTIFLIKSSRIVRVNLAFASLKSERDTIASLISILLLCLVRESYHYANAKIKKSVILGIQLDILINAKRLSRGKVPIHEYANTQVLTNMLLAATFSRS